MSLDAWAEIASLVALAITLGFAIVRPGGWPEAAVAGPAAAVLVGLGVVTPSEGWRQIVLLGPTVGFLAAILVLAHLADVEGVFAWVGARLAAGSTGRPRRLLVRVFVAAALTTAVLSLDATVVLLTPVVLAAAVGVRARPRPHLYACTHLANSASLLLPVSNLTNLLAFAASGLAFGEFAALMALPWLIAVLVEYAVFRGFFRRDLVTTDEADDDTDDDGSARGAPVFALAVLAVTLAGFGVSGLVGVEPAVVAVAGALVLAVHARIRHRIGPLAVVRAAAPLFCLFVFALAVIVAGVSAHGLGPALVAVLPTGADLVSLVAVSVVAAVLANVVNNLPATLLLVSAIGTAGGGDHRTHAALVLAVLIGVNVGPNLTYVGSLATLLWRRVLGGSGESARHADFHLLGVLTVPTALVAADLALWSGLALTR